MEFSLNRTDQLITIILLIIYSVINFNLFDTVNYLLFIIEIVVGLYLIIRLIPLVKSKLGSNRFYLMFFFMALYYIFILLDLVKDQLKLPFNDYLAINILLLLVFFIQCLLLLLPMWILLYRANSKNWCLQIGWLPRY
jgi:hypothetical protein